MHLFYSYDLAGWHWGGRGILPAPLLSLIFFINASLAYGRAGSHALPSANLLIVKPMSFYVKLGQSLGFFMISPYLCTPKNKTKRKKALWNICLRKATMSSWLNFNTW